MQRLTVLKPPGIKLIITRYRVRTQPLQWCIRSNKTFGSEINRRIWHSIIILELSIHQVRVSIVACYLQWLSHLSDSDLSQLALASHSATTDIHLSVETMNGGNGMELFTLGPSTHFPNLRRIHLFNETSSYPDVWLDLEIARSSGMLTANRMPVKSMLVVSGMDMFWPLLSRLSWFPLNRGAGMLWSSHYRNWDAQSLPTMSYVETPWSSPLLYYLLLDNYCWRCKVIEIWFLSVRRLLLWSSS